MNKQETLALKGIALLMMIMVHMNTNSSTLLVTSNDWSLWELFGNICHPVSFFLILSGYGLRHVYEHGDKHHYGRIFKVFIHYWAIIAIFVLIGAIKVGTDVYPGNITKVIENITSYHTSYNYECWFLFPFAILSLSYPITMKALNKLGIWFIVAACLMYFATGFIISHYHLIYKTAPHLLYNLLQVFFLLFAFISGAAMKKYELLERIKNKTSGKVVYKIVAFFLLLLMMLSRHFYKTSAFGPIEALYVFIMVFVLIQHIPCGIPKFIGKHSMNIWMMHTYFLYYLFHDEVYSLGYTILVYTVTLLLSLICSFGIDLLTKKIDKKIYSMNF